MAAQYPQLAEFISKTALDNKLKFPKFGIIPDKIDDLTKEFRLRFGSVFYFSTFGQNFLNHIQDNFSDLAI